MEFEIKSITLHHIDFENELLPVELGEIHKRNAEEYAKKIIRSTLENEDVRYFNVKSEKTEVVLLVTNLIKSFLNDYEQHEEKELNITTEQIAATSINNHIEISNIIANRLAREEKEAKKDIKNLKTKIKKGSLIQAVLTLENNLAYMFAKVEHFDYLDKKDYEIHTGLPIEKIILKTCLITYDDSNKINSIPIYDSNPTISKYWSDGFLELIEASSNEHNTLKSFNAIEKVLVKKIKSDSPSDYSLLHNNLIGYYNQNQGFELKSLIENIFERYEPEQPEAINMVEIKNLIEKLAETNKFDRKFEIVPKIIRSKRRRIININPNIELTIKDNIENLKSIIHGVREPNEETYIKIKVNEEIYKEFNFK